MTRQNSEEDLLVTQLCKAIEGREAHAVFESAIADFPPSLRGVRPEGGPHSAWELLEHMRIAQNNILGFSRDPQYQSPAWPEGYWPATPAPESDADWERTIRNFQSDQKDFEKLLEENQSSLFAPLKHGDGQTLLREAMLIASHNSYHLGQLIYVKRLLTNEA